MVRVVLPSAMPGIASAAILGAVTSWSQFAIPFILLDNRDLVPVSVGVVNLRATAGRSRRSTSPPEASSRSPPSSSFSCCCNATSSER